MLKIRLQRIGRRNLAIYRIVVAEHTKPVKGKFIQKLGNYNPHSKSVVLNNELVISWLDKGAKPSNTVAKIFEQNKIKHKSIVFKTRQPAKSKKDNKTGELNSETPKIQSKSKVESESISQSVESENTPSDEIKNKK